MVAALEGRVGRSDPQGPLSCASGATGTASSWKLVGEGGGVGEMVMAAAQPAPSCGKTATTAFCSTLYMTTSTFLG